MKTFRRILAIFIPVFIICFGVWLAYRWNYIPHRQYTASDFSMPTLRIMNDQDEDGVDDLPDIFQGARKYIGHRPTYAEKVYESGYPTTNEGFYVDVVTSALREAGYDMQELVWKDYKLNPEAYEEVEMPSKNEAFRKPEILKIYFDRYFHQLTTELYDAPQDWQAGDIVTFASGHMGIVSEIRNENKVPWIIHHFMKFQAGYEQDVLELPSWGEITGHYRVKRGSAAIVDDSKVREIIK